MFCVKAIRHDQQLGIINWYTIISQSKWSPKWTTSKINSMLKISTDFVSFGYDSGYGNGGKALARTLCGLDTAATDLAWVVEISVGEVTRSHALPTVLRCTSWCGSWWLDSWATLSSFLHLSIQYITIRSYWPRICVWSAVIRFIFIDD